MKPLSRFLDNETPISPEEAGPLFAQAAVQAFEEGWSVMDVSFRIGDRAREIGLTDEQIESAIRDAEDEVKRKHQAEKREIESSQAGKNEGIPYADYGTAFSSERTLASLFVRRETSQFLNLEPVSLPWPPEDWRLDFIRLLDAAFEPDEPFALFSSAEARGAISKAGETIELGERVAATLRKLDNGTGGIRVNPCRGDREADLLSYRHVLIENRVLELGRQLAFYRALNVPCTALVNAGGQTIQAWVRIGARDKAEYDKRVAHLLKVLEECGFEVEVSSDAPLARAVIPGTLMGNRQQYLLALNQGLGTYEEWELWADAYLDGMPLIEAATTITKAPEETLELLEGIFRESHRVLFHGPVRSGKSLAAIDLSLSIASGEQWLGLNTEETSVLYVNMDSVPSTLVRRAFKIAEARGLEAAHDRLDYLHLMGIEKNVAEIADLVVKRVEAGHKWHQRSYGFIVLDGLGRYLPATEGMLTTGGDPVSTSLAIDRIAARTEAAVLIVLRSEEAHKLQLPVDAELVLQPTKDGLEILASGLHYPDHAPIRCVLRPPLLTLA